MEGTKEEARCPGTCLSRNSLDGLGLEVEVDGKLFLFPKKARARFLERKSAAPISKTQQQNQNKKEIDDRSGKREAEKRESLIKSVLSRPLSALRRPFCFFFFFFFLLLHDHSLIFFQKGRENSLSKSGARSPLSFVLSLCSARPRALCALCRAKAARTGTPEIRELSPFQSSTTLAVSILVFVSLQPGHGKRRKSLNFSIPLF